MHRGSQQRILNAEVMATIPSLLNSRIRPDHALLADAWNNELLFDEHTWTSVAATTTPDGDESVRQTHEKREQAQPAKDDLTYSVERSFAQLESFLSPKESSIVVFNALGWSRSGWLEADLPEGKELIDPQTRMAVPQEVLRVEKGTAPPGFGGATDRVRYLAENVPAVGYKLLSEVDKGEPTSRSMAMNISADVLENRFYRITLDAGADRYGAYGTRRKRESWWMLRVHTVSLAIST